MARLKIGEGIKMEVQVPESEPVVVSQAAEINHAELAQEVSKLIHIPQPKEVDLSPLHEELQKVKADYAALNVKIADLNQVTSVEDKEAEVQIKALKEEVEKLKAKEPVVISEKSDEGLVNLEAQIKEALDNLSKARSLDAIRLEKKLQKSLSIQKVINALLAGGFILLLLS